MAIQLLKSKKAMPFHFHRGNELRISFTTMSPCVARGEARPAFKRAFNTQLAVFTGKPSSRLEGDA